MHQQVAAHFKDSAEGWVPFRLDHIQGSSGWTRLSHYARSTFSAFSLKYGSFVSAIKTKFQSSLSALTLRIRYLMYLLKQEDPEVEQNRGFASDCLAAIIPSGRDLEVQSSLSLGWGSSPTMTGFRVVYSTLLSNCSWWQKSWALLYRNQSHDMVL